jgi:hypothetical protein
MEQHAGQQTSAAVFAAEGSARHHLGRIAAAAVAALLAAWMIALALGVLGGFGSLPSLPGSHSKAPSEASARTPHRQSAAPVQARHVVTQAPTTSPSQPEAPASGQTHPQATSPKTSATQTVQAPTSTVTTTTSHGQSAIRGPTTTGKPDGSPGNGTGGSGAPGQLR